MSNLRFAGRVVIITGAGGGLGREYALLFGSRGASVVVNDLGGNRSGEGKSTNLADIVVQEIQKGGGKAIADYHSVEEGEKIVKTAIDNFGRIDILINNAGILRDKSFPKLTEQDWDLIHRVHLRGSFLVTKAAWPYFRNQNYGRVIMTASNAGLFGNFGQTNYSAAKLGLVGLCNTLAIEGAKYNIHCNSIVPVAASRLTEDILPQNLFEQFKPRHVAPVVVWLCHESCPENGGIIEAAGGWVGKYRWNRSQGKAFIPENTITPESVRDNWDQITNMNTGTYPSSITEQVSQLISSLSGEVNTVDDLKSSPEHLDQPGVYRYNSEAGILYALGVGVKTQEPDYLKFLYENSDNFSILPTFGVIPSLMSVFESSVIQDTAASYKINYEPTKILHGEHYLELRKPIPSSGTLISEPKILDVLDKGSGAVFITEVNTSTDDGEPLMYNQFQVFLVDAGNFGGKRMSDKKDVRNIVEHPNRAPDATIIEATSPDQAALYRLSGDRNPLHIDPVFAAIGGFNKPILHGLCTLGFAVRHILRQYADNDVTLFKSVKVRFSGTVLPGETIQTDMWKDGNRIYFQCTCKESGKVVITGAYCELFGSSLTDTNKNEVKSDSDLFLVSDSIFEELERRVKISKHLNLDVNEVFEFVITNEGKPARSWIIDFKTTPSALYPGPSKSGSPACSITISDQDMAALAIGSLDPVKAFMTGRMKCQGNPMLTNKLQPLFEMDSSDYLDGVHIKTNDDSNDSRSMTSFLNENENWKAAPFSQIKTNWNMEPYYSETKQMLAPAYEESHNDFVSYSFAGGNDSGGGDSGPVCKIDGIFENWLAKRLEEMQDLIPMIKTVYQWNILKDGKIVSVWTCDFKNDKGAIHRGSPKGGKADCTITLDDALAVSLFEGKADAMKAFMTGKLKISGNILAAQKLQQLWSEESPKISVSEAIPSTKKISEPTSSDSDIENIPCSGLKADIIFNIFMTRMHEEPDFLKRLRVIFQFNIMKDGKPICIWTADNKTKSETQVYRYPAKNVKPECTITIEDDDLLKIMVGKVNPQRLFMMGKVKVKGNIMLLQKLNSLWLEFQKLGKTPELPMVVEVMLLEPLKTGLKSEAMVIELIQRLVRLPELTKDDPSQYVIKINKDNQLVSTWTLDLVDKKTFRRGDANSPDSVLTCDDTEFAKLVLLKTQFPEVFSSGKAKIEGPKKDMFMQKLKKLFDTPTSAKPKL